MHGDSLSTYCGSTHGVAHLGEHARRATGDARLLLLPGECGGCPLQPAGPAIGRLIPGRTGDAVAALADALKADAGGEGGAAELLEERARVDVVIHAVGRVHVAAAAHGAEITLGLIVRVINHKVGAIAAIAV